MLNVRCWLLDVFHFHFTGYCQTQSPFSRSTEPPFLRDDLSAVILFIPADGIENKLPVVRAAIMQRLAVDDVMRELLR